MRKVIVLLSIIGLLFVSCKKSKKGTNSNVNPPVTKTGKIKVTTDWSQVMAGVEIPTSYFFKVGDYQTTLTAAMTELDQPFSPGNYTAHVYNQSDQITLVGEVIQVKEDANGVHPLPAWFFYTSTPVKVNEGETTQINVVMKQHVGELTFVVHPDELTAGVIAGLSAHLDGIAAQWNLSTGLPAGASSKVKLTFERQPDGSYRSVVRVLGVSGDRQKLNLTVLYKDETSSEVEQDFSEHLANMNSEITTPITFESELTVAKVGAEFIAEITPWRTGSGGSGVAQ